MRPWAVMFLALGVTTCQLDELVGPPDTASLVVAPAALQDSAAFGSKAVRTLSTSLGNTGPGTLTWTATRAGGSTWLQLGATSGRTPFTLSVTLDPEGLAAGVYRDTIVITGGTGGDAQKRVPVAFTVHPCHVTAIAPGASVIDSLTNADCAAPTAVGRFAQLYRFTAGAGDSVSVRLTSSDFDTFVLIDSSATGGGTPLAQDDNCRGVTGDACLLYVLLPEAGDYLIEVTSSLAGATGRYTLSFTFPRPPNPGSDAAQLRGNGATAISVGSTVPDTTVVLQARISDPDAADGVLLEIELQPVGTPFSGSPTDSSAIVGSGDLASVTITGLPEDTDYRWQHRTRDETGRASAWTAFGGNGDGDTDFRTAIPQAPHEPSQLAQLRSDGTTIVGLGATVPERTLVFAAEVADADQGDLLRLEVEVQPVGVAFTGVPTGSSVQVPSGQTAIVTVAGINDDVAYHWRARTTDQSGSASAWVAFGGNDEAAADFRVAVPATRLAFLVHPSGASAGAPMVPAVEVRAVEASGVTDTAFAGSVAVAITGGTGTAGAVLGGTRSVVASGGVATFPDLTIDRVGAGYTLTATSSQLTAAASNPFDIGEGAAAQLAFTVQPSTVVAGRSIVPAVEATVRDAQGNVVTSFGGDVTIAIAPATGTGGAALLGPRTVTAQSGVATFSGLAIDSTGTGYRLQASGAGLTTAVSDTFSVVPGSARRLTFAAQPAAGVAGIGISPTVRVAALDSVGNVATGFTGGITVALDPATGTSGAQLLGTLTVGAVAGIATFPDISVDLVGTGYRLLASAAPLTGAISAAFNVTAGGATQLAFGVQPGNVVAGAVISPAVTVTARDPLGNLVTGFTGNVTVAISAGSGTPGAVLLGTRTRAAVNGVATFNNLSIRTAGTGYTLTATATGLALTQSQSFDVTPATAATLRFTVEPSDAMAGQGIAPAPTVTALDQYGNVATAFGGTVAMAITAGTGTAGATLTGITSSPASAGVAIFGDLRIDLAGTGYTLTTSSGTLTPDTSAAFAVTASGATRLAFTVEPSNVTAGVSIAPAIRVTAYDAAGNVATGFTSLVTLGITPGTGTAGAGLLGAPAVAAVSGVATFGNVQLDSVGAGYTLTVSAGSLVRDTSAAFAVRPASATRVGFTVEPSDVVAGSPITPSVRVTAFDQFGNVDTAFAGAVAVTLLADPSGSATLSGTLSRNPVAGVATFNDLSLDRAVSGYTLRAIAAGVAADTSATFTVDAAAGASMQFTAQPPSTVTAGDIMNPAPTVTVYDQLGNVATGFAGIVAMRIDPTSGTPGAALSGTVSVAAMNGVAAFGNLRVDLVGSGYRLEASSGALPAVLSTPFDVTQGAANRLVFAQQPSDVAAGAVITPPIRVVVQDGFGNVVTSFTGALTLAIAPGTGTGGAGLGGTITRNAVGGEAAFDDIHIDLAGTGYQLNAFGSNVTSATSSAFTISAGGVSASQSSIAAAPLSITAGSGSSTVTVTARDAYGNPISGATVRLSATGTGNTITQPAAPTNAAGQTTGSLASTVVGTKVVSVSVDGTPITGTVSVAVTAASAARLAFSTEPTNSTAGVALGGPPRVTAYDAYGNVATAFAGAVDIAILSGSGTSGASLSGTTSVTASAGVAPFPNLSIDLAGTAYRLRTTSGALISDTSVAFTVAPAGAARLSFTREPPATTAAGVAMSPGPQVTAYDPYGNVVTTFGGTVTLTLQPLTGTSGASLLLQPAVAAVNGVATFASVSVDSAGSGYRVIAASGALVTDTSATFAVTGGSAARLAYTVEPPTSAVAGVAMTPAPRVTAYDALGNVASSFTGSVTLQITAGTGTAGAAVVGTPTVTAVSGVAQFANVGVDLVGTGYRLTALSGTLVRDTSRTFAVTPAGVARLVFTREPPAATTAGVAMTPGPQVTAYDQFGNLASGFTGNVALALMPATGTAGATLLGSATAAAASGVATFSNVSVDLVGAGYRVIASSGAAVPDTSAAFTVGPGAATQITVANKPNDTGAGAPLLPAPEVRALDAYGNLATGFTGNVTLVLDPASGTPGAHLRGPVTVAAAGGIATYPGVSIDSAGTRYRLQATSGTLTLFAPSGPFDILIGPAVRLGFGMQPSTTAAGLIVTPAVSVAVLDSMGNRVTTRTDAITMAMLANPGGAALGGTLTRTATGGIAFFDDLTLDRAGVGYTLRANAAGLASDTSATFTVTSGTAARVVFTQQPPASIVAGTAMTPAVVVTVQDQSGNTVTTFNDTVTVALANAGGATLSGTLRLVAAGGVATFPNLSVDRVGTGYALTASGRGVSTGATSTPFAVTAAAAASLVYAQQPSNAVAGQVITPAIRVEVRDAFGNVVPVSTPVTLAITSGTGTAGAVLSGTATVTTTNGVAQFANLAIDRAGLNYTLTASDGGLPSVASAPFTISVGGASRLAIVVQPSNTLAGAAITPSVQVAVQDASGNVVTGATDAITLAIANNPGGGTLAGTTTQSAVNGVATFPGLSINRVGTGYTLGATSGTLTAATSNPFDISAGTASQLTFTQPPSNVVAGAAISPAVTVTVQDANGNTVTSYTTPIGLTIGTNPGGGTLTGGAAVTPTAGVATFAGLSVNRTGVGYTLVATSGGLTRTSAAFNVTAGTPDRVVFSQQPPAGVVAGAVLAPPVGVTVQDANGNTVTGYTDTVTVALGANPGGSTLSGTLRLEAVAGVATFGDLRLNRTGTGYTLTAVGRGVPTGATSTAFQVTPSTPTALVFSQQPSSAVALQPISPPVRVAVRDSLGNTVTSATTSITVAIGTDPAGGATLSGTRTVSAVSGVAEFSTLSIDRAGVGYTLTANGGSLPQVVSAAFDIQVGTGNRLAFTVQPSNAQAGAVIAPAIEAQVQDAGGNLVPTADSLITLVIAANPGGGVLSGTTTRRASGGVATFDDLRISDVGTGYTLAALGSGLVSTTSAVFDITTAATTTAITNRTPTASVTGQPVTVSYAVSVTPPGSGTPTGTVTVSDGIDSCTGSVAAGACVITFTSAGTKSLTASYGGDANVTGSVSPAVSHVVGQAATTTRLTADTPDPSVTGQPITVDFSVTVNSPGGGTPLGTVTVSDGAASCAAPPSAGSCQLVPTTAGTKTLTATYSGTTDFTGSSDTEAHVVNRANATVAVTGDVPDPSVVGQAVSVSYTVTAASPGSGTPTGTVTVTDGTVSCAATVAAGSCTLVFLTPGAKTITATYAGDTDFNGGASPGVAHTVGQSPSTTTITSDLPDPSVTGQLVAVQFSVVATPPGAGTPSGTVTVSDGTTSCNATVAQGSCQIPLTVAGARTLTATYGGDVNFAGSSDTESHTVNAAPTTTTITTDTPDPSVFGTPLTVAYSVVAAPPGAGSPTGTVTVSAGADSCAGTVAAGSCVLTFTSGGAKTLTATYAGTTDWATSSDTEPHQVDPASTTATIVSDLPDPSTQAQAVTVSYTVTSAAGTPTGNVTVSDGVDSCIGTVATGGCQLTLNTTGARSLTARYAGDGSFAPVTSAPVPHQVNPVPTVTMSSTAQAAPEAVGTVTVVAQLDVVSGQTVTVPFSVGAGSTATGADYGVTTTSPLTISAGQTTATISVAITDDALDEADETVVLTLGTPTNATLGSPVTHTVTIQDNDAAPTVTLAVAPTSVAEAAGVATVTATLSGASGLPVTVDLGFTGTATQGPDYAVSGGSILIPAGSLAGSVTVTAVQDVVDEANETVIVDITAVTNGTESGTQQGTVTIVDDDSPPTVTLGVTPASIAEAAGVATVTATLSGVSGLPVTVDLGFTGTATLTADYTRSGTQIVIPAGSPTGTVTVTAVQDAVDEPDETVVVDITAVTNGTESGTQQGTVTIVDDDSPPTVTLGVAPASIAEAAGVATVTATLSGASGLPVTVDLGFTGTASAGTDYTTSGASIPIPAGSLAGTVTVTAVQDAVDEPDETVVVDITAVTNGTESGTQQVTATIADDDNPPTVAFSAATDARAENPNAVNVTVGLSAASARDVTIPYTVAGTATGGGVDYSVPAGPLTISAGATSANIVITMIEDALQEVDETVIVTLGTPANATLGAPSQFTLTITDDDAAPTVTFTAATQSGTENTVGTMTVTAQLSAASGLAVTVPYTVGGTATAGADYTIPASPLVIPAGQGSGAITITVNGDGLDELDETVVVTMGTPVNATPGATTVHTATIVDDDAGPTVTLGVTPASIGEAAGVATVTATLSGASGLPVTVTLGYTGTATVTTDYTTSGASIVIPAGSLTGTATITAVDDNAAPVVEPSETVVVDITGVTNGTESGTQQVTVTIVDNDALPTVTFAAATQSGTENTVGTMTVTAQLSATYGSAVTVPYTVGGTATAGAGADYTIPASPLVIPAGQGSGAITITVNGDGLDEPDETVIVTMGTPVNATPGATTVHTATIVDDDAAPTVAFTVAAQSNLESVSPVTATVQLSAASGQAVTVPYTVDAASTATGGGTDYSLGTASPLSIAAGTTTATISLSVIGDGVVEPDETVLLVLGGPTNATLGAIPNQTITIQNDDAAPPAPVITSPTGGSLTNDNTPTITGTAQTGTTVEVFDGVASLGTTAAAGGTWSLTPAPLADGSHTVTAQATDGAGNTGSLSAGVTFTVDATVPAAPVILSPTQNEALLTATPTVTGTAEAAATVAVLIDGAVSGTTAADGAGAWSYTVPAALATGPHTVRARATDAAGNTGPDSGTTDFTVP